MGKIKNTRVLASDPETTSAPRFNFRQYRVGDVYHNDGNDIDFVTDNKSLYVCLVESVQASKENIAEQEGLLKLVSQGEQGVPGANGSNGTPGVTPRIGAHFDGKQMIVTANGNIIAVSPDLGGPSWKPVVDGTTLSWELTTDRYSPAPIDLTTLRPISEHPILLRTNSDNTKYDWETSGPANYIQWKYEGDEYWNNLISISELMNLALAGVSFWYNEDTQEWHFGHKEVIRASYTADKNGRKIISDVELGDILFDAGAVPMPDYEFDIEEIQTTIEQIQANLEGYATEAWVEGKGYLTGVDLDDYAKKSEIPELTDAYTKAESDAKYQPKGSYLTAVKTLGGQSLEGTGSLPLATINGNSLFSNTNYIIPSTDNFATKAELSDYVKSVNNVRPDSTGNVTISVGNLSFDVKIESNKLYKSTDGSTWTLVGSVNGSSGGGSGEGCETCWSQEDILALISNPDLGGFLTKTVADSLYLSKADAASQYMSKTGVSVDALINTGEHIADIVINGITTALYAPTGSGGTGSGERYRIFMIYQRTNSSTVVPDVSSSSISRAIWDTTNDTLSLTSNSWTNSPENTSSETPYLWMTSATFKYSTGSRIGSWETPICLTGEDGQDGVDGANIEFAYILCKEAEYAALKNITPTATYGDGRPDDLPSGSTASGYTWSDHPYGISREFPIEAITIRKKIGDTWSEYTKPVIWSKWGEDGVDGDGVEYIFARATEEQTVRDAAGDTRLVSSYTRPNNSWAYDSPVAPWYDNPMGTTEEEPYVFCSQRKTVDADANVKEWGPWSEPSLWSNYAKKGDKGDPGEPGGPGPAGPAGDQYEYVYGLAGSSIPVTKEIDATEIDSNERTSSDDGYLPKFVFDKNTDGQLIVNATATPTGVSSTNRYEYVSVRRKHNDVWGSFSAPALRSNFVEAGLTDEQLNNIKNDVENSISDDLNAAKVRLTDAENRLADTDSRLENLDNEVDGITLTTNDLTGRVQEIEARAVYSDEDIRALAELEINAKEATIKEWAGAKFDSKLSDVGLELNAIKSTVTEWADFTDAETGELSTVMSRLNAAEGTISNYADRIDAAENELTTVKSTLDAKAGAAEIAATREYADNLISSARTEWNAADAQILSSVANAKYVWAKYDSDNKLTDVQTYTSDDDEWASQGYTKELVATALSAIRQTPGEVDIVANWGDDTWAQIIAKADESGSSIILDADHINLNGDTSATRAAIGHADITDATITRGTITDATISNCTITSSLQSSNYDNVNKEGFLLNAQNGDFALYAENGTQFDNINGIVFGGNQTISWSNITDTPTIITRESLTTNKIKANEIEAGAITANHIAGGTITGDKIAIGTITPDKLSGEIIGVTLKIDGNKTPVRVDESGYILKGTGKIISIAGVASALFKSDGTLLDWGRVYLGTINGSEITWESTPSIVINNYTASIDSSISVINGTSTSYISWGWASQHRCYAFDLVSTFTANTQLTAPVKIPIKVVDASGSYSAIDYIYLNPVYSERIVDALLQTQNVLRKDSEEATVYTDPEVRFSGFTDNDYSKETLSNLCYSYTVDSGNRVVFDTISNLTEGNYYFNSEGDIIQDSSNWFAKLWVYSKYNDSVYNEWHAIMYLNVDGLNIKDKLLVGVGYENEITDEEPIYVIWPGKDGEKGEDGKSVPYVYRGEWKQNVTYYNNEQQIDVVKYNNTYYICKTQNSATSFIASNWTAFVGQFENVATGLLLAEHAYVENLGVDELITQDTGSGKITINKKDSLGVGDNAIKGYAHGSNVAGINISGVALEEEVFEGVNTITYNASPMVYHFDASSQTTPPSAYNVINGSGDYYVTTTTNTLTIDSTYNGIEITSAPAISWSIEQGGTILTETDVQESENTDFMLPYLNLALVDVNNSSNHVIVGGYAGGIEVESSMWHYGYESYGGVGITPGTYKFALIPYEEKMVTFDGSWPLGGFDFANAELHVTSSSGTIRGSRGEGTSQQGVTLAPNGICVYFGPGDYLQFIKTDAGVKAVFKVDGIDRLSS